MIKKLFFLPLILLCSCMGADAQDSTEPVKEVSFYTLTIDDIEGNPISMEQFRGKYVLAVNVASKCGYTKQYEPLQKLYEQYGEKLVIIGFPSNQFLGQEPGSEAEIVEFCEKNYGVTFPMTSKIDVKGKDQHPIYQWLTSEEMNGVSTEKVSWNFNKFLISPEGKWLAYYGSGVDPLDEEITSKIK